MSKIVKYFVEEAKVDTTLYDQVIQLCNYLVIIDLQYFVLS